jgi:hypothetical protein
MTLVVTPVRQQVSGQHVADVAAEVHAGLEALPLRDRVQPAMRVAVAVGSRGITCLTTVVETVLEALRELGADPFLVPAMGSHGGGTAEGQRAVLESYGLHPDITGAPILSDMEAIEIGTTPEGIRVYFDRHAAGADAIIAVNRIKEHTAFKGRWESGLLKIIAVGLGKARGAAEIHNRGVREAMPAAARLILKKMPVIAGVGIIENGYHQPARIAVLPAERIEAEEPALLDLARQLMPRIPFEPLDLLVVKEMGKDISGTGMDLNVIGMWRRTGGPVEPLIDTVAVLELTGNSHGNAIGVGHADLISQRLRDQIDQVATDLNCLTSHNLPGGKIPITLGTDRQVIAAGLAGIPAEQARVLFIRNTLALEMMWASAALLPAVAASPALTIAGPGKLLPFTPSGALNWSALP